MWEQMMAGHLLAAWPWVRQVISLGLSGPHLWMNVSWGYLRHLEHIRNRKYRPISSLSLDISLPHTSHIHYWDSQRYLLEKLPIANVQVRKNPGHIWRQDIEGAFSISPALSVLLLLQTVAIPKRWDGLKLWLANRRWWKDHGWEDHLQHKAVCSNPFLWLPNLISLGKEFHLSDPQKMEIVIIIAIGAASSLYM